MFAKGVLFAHASSPNTRRSAGHSYHVVPIVITLFGGIVMAFGSCVGFLSALNINGSRSSPNMLNTIYAAGFCAGLIAALAGIVWAIAAFIMFLIHLASDEP